MKKAQTLKVGRYNVPLFFYGGAESKNFGTIDGKFVRIDYPAFVEVEKGNYVVSVPSSEYNVFKVAEKYFLKSTDPDKIRILLSAESVRFMKRHTKTIIVNKEYDLENDLHGKLQQLDITGMEI